MALLDRLGFARGVVVQGNAHGYDNSAILDGVGRFPNRLRGVCIVAPETRPENLAPMREAGVTGLRFHHFFGTDRPTYRRGVGLEVFGRLQPRHGRSGHAHAALD